MDSADRVGSQEEKLRNRDFSPYIQDDIKLRPNLTVNIGLRWDIMVPFTAIGNNIVFINPTIPNPGAGGLLGAATEFGNCAGCAGYDRAYIRWNHLSPRVGFSYAFNNKTVLQGGFAQNYMDGGAYEYGTSKVAVNYGNLLTGSFHRNSTGSTTPGFGSWDSNILPEPAHTPFSPSLGIGQQHRCLLSHRRHRAVRNRLEHRHPARIAAQYVAIGALHRQPGQLPAGPVEPS